MQWQGTEAVRSGRFFFSFRNPTVLKVLPVAVRPH
jgi:hypothetical protein